MKEAIQEKVDDLLSAVKFQEPFVDFLNSLSGLSSTSDLQTAIAVLVITLKDNLVNDIKLLDDQKAALNEIMATLKDSTQWLADLREKHDGLQDEHIKILTEHLEVQRAYGEALKDLEDKNAALEEVTAALEETNDWGKKYLALREEFFQLQAQFYEFLKEGNENRVNENELLKMVVAWRNRAESAEQQLLTVDILSGISHGSEMDN